MDFDLDSEETPRIERPRVLLAAALALGGLADLLLFGQDVGLGWSLFLMALPVAFLALCGRSVVWREAGPLLAAQLFFAAMLSVRTNDFVVFLDFCASLMLLSLLGRFARTGGLARLGVGGMLWAPLPLVGHALFAAAPQVLGTAAEVRADPDRKQRVAPVLRGLLLTVPVLVVLVPLLVSADAVFQKQVYALADALLPKDWPTRIGRLLLALLTAWLIAGGFVYSLTRRRLSPVERAYAERPLGFVEAGVVLGSVAALFAAFLAVQAQYLFGGAARVLAVPGLTYAEYARRGFAELVGVAVLTLALILILGKVTRRDSALRHRAFSALSTVLIGETLVMLLSAWRRMAAYEAAYGASPTRIVVDTFILWLGVALLWLALTLWHPRLDSRFAVGGLVCALGFAATLNLVNPDRMVVRSMAARWRETGKAPDVWTLAHSAGDAYPEASALARELPAKSRAEFAQALGTPRRTEGWPSWNAARRAR